MSQLSVDRFGIFIDAFQANKVYQKTKLMIVYRLKYKHQSIQYELFTYTKTHDMRFQCSHTYKTIVYFQ